MNKSPIRIIPFLDIKNGFIFEELSDNYNVGIITVIFRKEILKNLKKKFDERFSIIGDFDFFIRNDADRLVFSGIHEVLDMAVDKNLSWTTGVFFDYVMNLFRGGTPSVIKRECLEHLLKNQHLMQDVQKPEAAFSIAIENKFSVVDVKIFTNLHEFEQYPSKVCNAFLNRLARNHYPRLYDDNYLRSLPVHYQKAIALAFEIFAKQGNKNSMKFQDFSFLDEGFEPLSNENLEGLYDTYHELYQRLSLQYQK